MAIQVDVDVATELVDAVVAAADGSRTDEVHRLRAVLADIGLAQAFDQEWRLAGLASSYDEYWPGAWL